ncbi:hypothetical protein MKW94_001141, partial [Papaver nudicaule]|nr:hypothetical protein [Papaver nudicaule]
PAMVPEPTNNHKKSSSGHSVNQRNLDREVRDMLSTLTNRLTDLHSNNESSDQSIRVGGSEDEENHGVKIITLAGTNMGATMKAESSDEHKTPSTTLDNEALTAYANSNFQAINNSIMFGGSYKCRDPGVHMETSDYADEEIHRHHHNDKHRNKKGKAKEASSSKRNSTSSDDETSSSDSDDE